MPFTLDVWENTGLAVSEKVKWVLEHPDLRLASKTTACSI
jgi:hypothetical protein